MSKNTTLVLAATAVVAAYLLNKAAQRKIEHMNAVLKQHDANNAARNYSAAAHRQHMEQMRQFENMFGPELSERLRAHAGYFRQGMGM
jgi:glycosyltransferase A (GT-A) superfamily protein (DUF2064 family)